MFLSAPCRPMRAAIACVSIAGALASPHAAADTTHGHIAPDGRFTPNQTGATFPPQPRSVQNIRQFAPIPDGADRTVTTKSAPGQVTTNQRTVKNLANERSSVLATALANSQVSNLLGQRYAVINTVSVKDKWGGDTDRYEVTFFSHSNNQTVSVAVEDGALDDLVATPASESQPPLAQTEMTSAVDLARAYWMNRGNTRISQLTGYAIQTFQADGSPYPSRVAYVSFHVASPESPELLSWVDLNSRQVIRAEVAQ